MRTSNTRIKNFKQLISPNDVRTAIPFTDKAEQTIIQGREDLYGILNSEDNRFIVISGPCSIHNRKSAIEYAEKLNHLRNKYLDKLYIIMRVYFEKPRTIDGWKGLIYDPFLNNTFDIEEGIKKSREILLAISELGMPTATEILDPVIAAYLGQLASWVAIGARNRKPTGKCQADYQPRLVLKTVQMATLTWLSML